MDSLIQPNFHPLIVHFPIAFLIVGPIFLLFASFGSETQPWRESVRVTGDWIFCVGIISLVLAIAAGFQAYFTVGHDGPSHLAMTDHRNWALGTSFLFFVFAVWRFAMRHQTPSKLFSILLLVPALLLAVTGWKGGHLVYQYGIGVSSLPSISGDGHDHDHGDAHEHESSTPKGAQHAEQVDGQISTPVVPKEVHEHVIDEEPHIDEHDHSGHEH